MKKPTIKLARRILPVLGLAFLASCSQQHFDLTPTAANFPMSVKYNRQADVLVVMEASGAMNQQQRYAAISAQIPAMVKVLNAAKLDYHLAVTTMTPKFSDPQTQLMIGDGGQFINHGDGLSLILNSGMANLGSVLTKRVSFGTSDFLSPMNYGRQAVKNALSEPLLSGVNAGFLRDQALLNVIFISSKDDDVNNTAPVDLAAFLDTLKPPLPTTGQRSWLAHYVGVLSNAAGDQCASAQWGYRSAGLKFLDVVNASGGTATTICSTDLTVAVQAVQARILQVVTSYYLSEVPNVSTIVVYEGGAFVAQDTTNGWTYDSATQSIMFHGTAIPADGTQFHVDYTPAGIK